MTARLLKLFWKLSFLYCIKDDKFSYFNNFKVTCTSSKKTYSGSEFKPEKFWPVHAIPDPTGFIDKTVSTYNNGTKMICKGFRAFWTPAICISPWSLHQVKIQLERKHLWLYFTMLLEIKIQKKGKNRVIFFTVLLERRRHIWRENTRWLYCSLN